MKTSPLLLSILSLSLLPMPSMAQEAAVPAAAPVFLSASTLGETNALFGAINKFRTDQGLAALAADDALFSRAAEAFSGVVNTPDQVDVTKLYRDFAATHVAVLRGVVTHRKAASGAEFPKYWAKDARWAAMMSGDFTHIGAATVKRSDGKLVAFVYLIRR